MAIEMFRANLNNVNQTNVSNTTTYTLAELSNAPLNEGGYFNTTTYSWTPPAGPVEIYAQAFFNGVNATGNNYEVRIMKNGLGAFAGYGKALTSAVSISASTKDRANGTDVYTMEVRGNGSAGPLTISGNGMQTFMTGIAYGTL